MQRPLHKWWSSRKNPNVFYKRRGALLAKARTKESEQENPKSGDLSKEDDDSIQIEEVDETKPINISFAKEEELANSSSNVVQEGSSHSQEITNTRDDAESLVSVAAKYEACKNALQEKELILNQAKMKHEELISQIAAANAHHDEEIASLIAAQMESEDNIAQKERLLSESTEQHERMLSVLEIQHAENLALKNQEYEASLAALQGTIQVKSDL